MKYKTILRLLNGENRWNFVAERKKNLACWVVVISTIFIKNNLSMIKQHLKLNFELLGKIYIIKMSKEKKMLKIRKSAAGRGGACL